MKFTLRLATIAIFTAISTLTVSAATFNVNTAADLQDATPGNGICSTSSKNCSLRAAITEANLLAGADTIVLPANMVFNQTLVAANEDNNAGGDWDVLDHVNFTGNQAILQPSSSAPTTGTERVLDIATRVDVTIQNATIRFGGALGAAVATARGGGIRNLGNLILSNANLHGNAARNGGAIYSEGNLRIDNSRINNNRCASATICDGGGVLSTNPSFPSTVELNNTIVEFNEANVGTANSFSSGGGMLVHGTTLTVKISGGRFNNNKGGSVSVDGGGLRVISTAGTSSLDIFNVQFYENGVNSNATASFSAGIRLLALGGTVNATFDRVKMKNNPGISTAPHANSRGGNLGIQTGGSGSILLSVKHSNFYGGKALKGGGVLIENEGSGTINFDAVNSSFTGNSAAGGEGGGFFLTRSIPQGRINLTCTFCTIGHNIAANGGAIFGTTFSVAQIFLKNSVIDYHASSFDITPLATSQGYNNFDAAPTTITLASTDTVGNSGLIWGPGSEYLVPLTTSPVINMIPNGVNDCGAPNRGIINDQLLNPRPYNGACDKGAIELQELGQGFWE